MEKEVVFCDSQGSGDTRAHHFGVLSDREQKTLVTATHSTIWRSSKCLGLREKPKFHFFFYIQCFVPQATPNSSSLTYPAWSTEA